MVAEPIPDQRCLIYCRVSTDKQEDEGTSLDSQEARGHAYAADRGYQVTAALRETWSGFELRRPTLDRLRELVRSRAIDVVISYAIDRLSRNQAHLAILMQEMDDAGVRYEFVTEQFENTAVGRFIVSARAFAAEIEREKIVERTQRGLRARVEAGKLPGFGPAPYGYAWNADRSALLIDPVTAPIARRIFAEVAAGRSMRQVAAGLARDGIATARGNAHWTHSTIHTLLTNPTYKGTGSAYRWSSRKVNGKVTTRERPEAERMSVPASAVPALIDDATWNAAQAQLDFNRINLRREPAQPEAHLLRGGFARCAYCGSIMVATWAAKRPMYRCRKGMTRPWECDHSGYVASNVVDAAVWRRVERTLQKPDLIAAELERQAAAPDTSADDLAATERALGEIARQQANLVSSLGMVSGSAATLIAERLNALDRQRDQIEAERQRVLARAGEYRRLRHRIGQVTRLCERVAARLADASYEKKRLALSVLGVTAQVYRRGSPERFTVAAEIELEPDDETGTLLDVSARVSVQQAIATLRVSLPAAAD